MDTPRKIEGLANIEEISAGSDYTICKDAEGNLYSFGVNKYGQLG